MMKYFISIMLLASVAFASMSFKEDKCDVSRSYKYNLSVCGTFSNEADYLREWIEFHLLAGVDHFYLYSIESTDHFDDVLAPYIKKGIVSVVRWPNYMGGMAHELPFLWTLGLQIPAYEHAIVTKARKETKWLVFLNVDEFLVPMKSMSMKELLKKYDSLPGISISTNHFQGNSLDFIPRKKLMLEMTNLTAPPDEHIQNKISKVVFKPEYYKGFSWPPYECLLLDKQKPIAIAKNVLRVNRYLDRFKGNINFAREKEMINVDHQVLSDDRIESLLISGYEIQDRKSAVQRFLPKLFQRMGYEPYSGCDE